MTHSVKLLFNTIASLGRIIVNAISTLIATRIALNQLGESDFGLFNLIAGIIVMLSFFSGALSISGQRFFSIALGKKDTILLNKYFNSSLGIHIFIGIFTIITLFLIEPLLFNGFLNIKNELIPKAIIIYRILILSSGLTIACIPFSALSNAYEDLGIIAISDILSSIIKLFGALFLVFFTNKLIFFSFVFLISFIIKDLINYFWCRIKYPKIYISANNLFNKEIWKEMFSFVSWNTLGSLAVVIRNQGVAIVLNIYFGTIINASYGVANQVNSLVLSFATALTTVFAPSIIQAYGANDMKRTKDLSILSSKLSFMLSGIMAIPILSFLHPILEIWLKTIPPHTEIFTGFIIICFLIQQLYPGLNRAIYATGVIKFYQIYLSVTLISIIPLGAICYQYNMASYSIFVCMLISQLLTLIITVNISSKLLKINKLDFWNNSVLKPVLLFSIILIIGITTNRYIIINIPLLISLSFILVCIFSILYMKFILTNSELSYFKKLYHDLLKRL